MRDRTCKAFKQQLQRTDAVQPQIRLAVSISGCVDDAMGKDAACTHATSGNVASEPDLLPEVAGWQAGRLM